MSEPVFARTIHVSSKDLPVCCPQPGEALWCAHPRVYLPLNDAHEAVCYYCSTRYVCSEDSDVS